MYMQGMLAGSSFNQSLANWNTASAIYMNGMFSQNTAFNQNIGLWNTSGVTTMSDMFNGASAFNQDLTGWCVSNLTTEPSGFSANSALSTSNKPLWGKEFTIALTSGSQAQTVTATTAITPIQYTATAICSGATSVNASNLPSGVSAALSNNVATISGTPTGNSSGTFNYSLTVSGSATSQIVTGTIVVNSPPANIYFENGTCKCSNASLGDTATISGAVYTVVNNSTIAGQIANGNVNLCTSLVTEYG